MKLQLLFLILFFTANVYSQYEYKQGYIVKNDGDTEEGLINFKDNEFNAKKCQFIKDGTTDPVIYSPDEIVAYRFIDSKYFESKEVSVGNENIDIFLECLISGESTIYYTRWNSQDYYYLEIDEELHELSNDEVVRVVDGVDYTGRSHQYIGLLKYYLSDCPSVVEKLDNADLTRKSLINISKEYHEYICPEEQCIIYEKVVPVKRFNFGFDFSYGVTKLEFSQNFGAFSMEPANHFQFSINSQIRLDEAGAYLLQLSLGYYSFKNELLNNTVPLTGVSTPNDVYYEFALLKPTVQMKYEFRGKKIFPFASVGFSPSIFLKDKGELYSHNFLITVPFTSRGDQRTEGSMNGMLGGLRGGKWRVES